MAHGVDARRRDRVLRTLIRNLFDYHQQVSTIRSFRLHLQRLIQNVKFVSKGDFLHAAERIHRLESTTATADCFVGQFAGHFGRCIGRQSFGSIGRFEFTIESHPITFADDRKWLAKSV